jgi:hypothetical protein
MLAAKVSCKCWSGCKILEFSSLKPDLHQVPEVKPSCMQDGEQARANNAMYVPDRVRGDWLEGGCIEVTEVNAGTILSHNVRDDMLFTSLATD